jgi:diguanylate cyclase (GGDEF)-like protein
MPAVEPLLAILAAITLILVVIAVSLAAALLGHGPLRRFVRRPDTGRREAAPHAGLAISPSVQLLARGRRDVVGEALLRRGIHASDAGLDEILQGTFAPEAVNRAVRVLAWSFILIVLVTVSVSQLWQPVQPRILATLVGAGLFVLVVHEVLPPTRLGMLRVLLEASAAILFVTMLVLLTGNASSPFFFVYALLVGGAALVASPVVTVLLAVETSVAYAVAAFSTPLTGEAARDALTRVAINLTALVLLAYAGMVMSRMQRRTREAAIRLSTVDSLTDLSNRAYFFNSVDREIQRSHRFGRGLCLLMMDLDGLKSINDRYGHYQGDLVLRGVAHVIRSVLRGVDVPARYGGDEFVALLPETDSSGALVVAEKIRIDVSELVVDANGQRITTSLSIGVVTYPEDGKTADELMIAADAAMYSSKRMGKNRVVGYADQADFHSPFVTQSRRAAVSMGFRPLNQDAAQTAEHRGRSRVGLAHPEPMGGDGSRAGAADDGRAGVMAPEASPAPEAAPAAVDGAPEPAVPAPEPAPEPAVEPVAEPGPEPSPESADDRGTETGPA